METLLKEEFVSNNFFVEDDSVLEKCAALCVSFGLSPAELVSTWELFYLNRQLEGGQVPNSCMNGFKQLLQEEQKRMLVKKQEVVGLHTYVSSHLNMLEDQECDVGQQTTPPSSNSKYSKQSHSAIKERLFNPDVPFLAPKTPVSGKSLGEAPRRKPEDSPLTPFSRRSNSCSIQLSFNEDLKERGDVAVQADSEDDVVRRLPPIEWCDVEVLSGYPKTGCRFMNDRVESRFLSVEKRLKRFAVALAASEMCSVSHNVAVASQEKITVIGRICCEGGEGHLNEKSVLLEGSVEFSGGEKVRLDLRDIPQFSLFPGQVLGVEGHNPSGHCLVASRLIDTFPPPMIHNSLQTEKPPSKRRERTRLQKGGKSPVIPQQISMIMAAGPYSASDNLLFEPLAELFAYARKKRPRVLVLMGPFVDSEHPLVKAGLLNKTFKQIFMEEVRTRVEEYCQEMGDGARVFLIPSCRDIHHDRVFPQPPFRKQDFDDQDDQISVLGNPSTVRCDDVTVAFCTVDIVKHLSGEEMSRTPAGVSSDRMTRLASHIIAQRSFYPLFPPAIGTSLDLSLMPEALSILQIPDVLVVPSDLAPFVKVLSPSSRVKSEPGNESELGNSDDAPSINSLCINPGRLTKGLSGGTFSEILIFPRSKTETGGEEEASPSIVSKRTKVVIRRI